MCDNWEFALKHARGRYVTYIGDDDALLPNGADRIIELIGSRPSRVYMWMPPIYKWPMDGRPAAIGYLPQSPAAHAIDLRQLARMVIKQGGWRYYHLPGVYHCAVETEVLSAIAKRVGRVFRSTQPDLYTSMSVPAVVAEALHIGAPASVNGHSARSNGAALNALDGKAVLERYINEFGDYHPHPSLSLELPLNARLVMDAIFLACDDFPELYRDTPLNHDMMLAFLCKQGLVSKSLVLGRWRALSRRHSLNVARFTAYAIAFEFGNIRRRWLNRFGQRGPFAQWLPADIFSFAVEYDAWAREEAR